MSKTIVVNRKLSEAEILEIKHLAKNGSIVYAFPEDIIPGISQKITIGLEEKRRLNFDIMEEVLRFGDYPVNTSTIADIFRIDTASIWHYHKFRVYFDVCNIMYFLHPLQDKFNSFSEQIWYVGPELNVLQKVIPEVEFRVQKKDDNQGYPIANLFKYLAVSTYRILRQFLRRKTNPEYLVYLTEKYVNMLHPKTLNPIDGNGLLEYLILKFDERFTLLTEVIMPKLKGKSNYSFSSKQLAGKWGRCQKIFLEGFMFSGLLSNKVRKTTQKAHQSIKRSYNLVHGKELTLIQKLIFEVFQSLDGSTGYYLFRHFSARKFFVSTPIKAVIAYDENSPSTKSVLDAAKFCGIKVIGLQHGTMHDLHPAYLYTLKDSNNHIMPDLTLAWGKYWETFLLEKGNYPAGSVISVGQIRTDIIPALTKAESQKEVNPVCQIVFASQPQRDQDLRFRAAFDVFKAAQHVPNAHLIVKLHPHEFGDIDRKSVV